MGRSTFSGDLRASCWKKQGSTRRRSRHGEHSVCTMTILPARSTVLARLDLGSGALPLTSSEEYGELRWLGEADIRSPVGRRRQDRERVALASERVAERTPMIRIVTWSPPSSRGTFAAFHRHRAELPGCWELISARDDLSLDALRALQPAYVFFPHWSWRVPKKIVEEFSCVCFHETDLPYGRGGSPLQNLIVRGHKSTM